MTKQRPVNHTEFARDIGCHYTLVTRYRNGERLPTVENIAKMVEVYDLDPMELIAAVNRAGEKGEGGEKTDPMAFARYLRDHIFTVPAGDGEKPAAPDPSAPLLQAGVRLGMKDVDDIGTVGLFFVPDHSSPRAGAHLSLTVTEEEAALLTPGARYTLEIRAAD